MIRAILLIPVWLGLVAGAGIGICAATKVDPHFRAMIPAAIICLLADELAIVPLIMARSGNQLVVSQAGLLGTIMQMLLAVALAGGAMLFVPRLDHSFVFWLFPFYFTSLILLVVMFVRAIRRAPLATQTPTS